jgi:hypothetical protein
MKLTLITFLKVSITYVSIIKCQSSIRKNNFSLSILKPVHNNMFGLFYACIFYKVFNTDNNSLNLTSENAGSTNRKRAYKKSV